MLYRALYQLHVEPWVSLRVIVNCYSESSIAHHVASWKRLQKWYREGHFICYDHDVESSYFEEANLCEVILTKQDRAEIRHIERILSIAETGAFSKNEPRKHFIAPKGFKRACDLYAEELLKRGLKLATRQGHLSTIRHFCSVCGDSNPRQLKV